MPEEKRSHVCYMSQGLVTASEAPLMMLATQEAAVVTSSRHRNVRSTLFPSRLERPLSSTSSCCRSFLQILSRELDVPLDKAAWKVRQIR
jgi:hypothetical protein